MNLAAQAEQMIAGYQIIERLYLGSRTVVYRVVRVCDRHPMILKRLRNEYPSFNELVQFRNQYTIAKNLNLPGVIQPYRLDAYENGYILVMEDFGGISLTEFLQERPLDISTFLILGIQLSDILHGLYQNRVIHKDIKPANILIHPKTKQVKLIDFSISSLLPRETQDIQNPNILEGTLAYISPEQTGRMNRGIDYRSDFYALGVTFYELLTGTLPFISNDPMELVHFHLAKKPLPIHQINSQIPPILSKIIAKLMAKNAEDRYQSALGIKQDLQHCLTQWKKMGTITEFIIAQQDRSDRFILPEKLYGRETEVQALLNAFERVANGTTEMMLVAGFSGIGKTAVINEVHKPIVRKRGYFIKGKYDQFNRNIPFSSFVQAFRDLMIQLLGESDENIENWKEKILDAVGDNGAVIIDVIPELEKIIGQQSEVPELSGNAAQNRFNLVFGKFVNVFTTKDHPLVLFLDDLQWADSASLNLLKLLMNDSGIGSLLVLGAYRDNEISPAHPLMLTLNEIQKQEVKIHTLTLASLNEVDITKLIAETLLCEVKIAAPLSQLVNQKTGGNPFFTTQFLKGLHEEDYIQFDQEAGYWQCNLTQIRQLALTNDVVEFMVERLRKLPKVTQNVLKLGACIGNHFDLATLAVVCEEIQEEVATDLWRALQDGFIIPENETYKFFQGEQTEEKNIEDLSVRYRFLHDRVQQAAYSLIPEDQKQISHLKIGQLLLQNTSEQEREENLFKIVNQLNMGILLLKEPIERENLAQLNLAAAQKAKSSAAYDAAVDYLKTAINLLSADTIDPVPWQTHDSLMLQLHTLLAEVSYLNGEFETAEQQIQTVLENATDIFDRIKVQEIRIQLLIAQKQCQAALDLGLEILTLLNVPLNDAPVPEIDLDRLYSLPEITDQRIITALRILSKLWAPAFIANPGLLPSVILTMLNLSVTHGNSAMSAFAYALYGMLLCATMTDIELGYRFGQLALHTLDRYEDADLTCKVNQLFHAFIRNWKELARDRVECLANNVFTGLETGDIEFACYSAINYCDNLCLIGESLAIVHQKQTYYIELTHSLRQEFQYFAASIWGQFVENLMGQAINPKQLVGQRFDEQQVIPQLRETNAFTALFFFHTAKTILYYLFADYEQTLAHSESATQYEQACGGLLPITQIPFYRALALLVLYPTADRQQQAQMLAEVKTHQQRLEVWATHGPNNFQHKLDLIAAETARIMSHREGAIELYDRAISGAKDNKYIQEEALANELAAKFYLDWGCAYGNLRNDGAQSNGKEKLAAVYMQQAYYCYARWGAKAKTSQLETQYPQLLSPILQTTQPQLNGSQTSSSHSSLNTFTTATPYLDFTSAIKASHSISGEIEPDVLLSKLMKILLEHAGADQGSLILNHSDHWEIAVQSIQGNCRRINTPLAQSNTLPNSIINTVKRNQKAILINQLEQETHFTADPYFYQHQPKSLFCTPVLNQAKLIGILYLENNLTAGSFTQHRIEILNLLTAQAAISIENARLYQRLEDYSYNLEFKVQQRTQELQKNNQHLQDTLQQLQQTQTQLIQTEKMSSLGRMVAGIAHEINNPIGFIAGNISFTRQYFQDLLEILDLYQEHSSPSNQLIQTKLKDIDIDFLRYDLEKILDSMQNGSDRIRKIVLGLRNFSRLDESKCKEVNLHDGLENTLLIVQHRLRANGSHPEIIIDKNYGILPKIKCYANQINQVFLQIITNAIDVLTAFEEKDYPKICITTEMKDPQTVRICIGDNGPGMSPDIYPRIFDPFFTTKPVGQGTGLGLSISYQIITEQHRGKLQCFSQLGKGTEFIIDLPI